MSSPNEQNLESYFSNLKFFNRASMSPTSPDYSEKTRKYDRQLRLWGDHGQQALESAHVCLINATALGTEILKSLVLPGIGSFTIVDCGNVTEEDISTNFFLDIERIGKSRAKIATQLLLELNPDVHGDFVAESVGQILENNPSFFNAFSIVIGTALSEKEVVFLATSLWELNIPLIISRSYGFTGVARLQIKEHTIIESHPDNQNADFRVLTPFPALKNHFESFDLGSMDLKDHAHVPFVVILYKYVQQFIKTYRKVPSTYKEKEILIDMIQKGRKLDENGLPHAEGNFEEAIKAVNYALAQNTIPTEIKELLNDSNCINLNNKSKAFWVMARALKDFVEKESTLPVRGSLPDMIAETKHFINLQQIYRSQAAKDSDMVFRRVQQLLRELNQPPESISEQDVNLFCKFSTDLRVLRTSSISHEYQNKVYNSQYITSQLEDPDSMMELYIVLRSIDRYYSEYKEYPGDLDNQVEPDIVKLKSCASKLMTEMSCSSVIKDELIHEFCRYGGAELHSVSAFLGGCIAHEIIKFITHQYVPFNNTIVYNAVTSNVATFLL